MRTMRIFCVIGILGIAVPGLSPAPSAAQEYPARPVRLGIGADFVAKSAPDGYTLLATAGTPAAIVDRLNAGIVRALRTPEVHERLVTQGGNELVTGTPGEFAALIRSDLRTYAKLIKDARIPAQ
jgi:tripartite-type tricarboxylate transporter receptor subunit TctC